MKNNLHTFVVCAYKEEPHLEECIKSLKEQTIKSKIIITTSTPNDFIKQIAKTYDVELKINKEKKGHINDFCFAYEQAKTKYVTLCHQDDIYYPNFAKQTIKAMEKSSNPIISFTNYYELKNKKIVKNNKLLLVKRLLNLPIKFFKNSKKIRKFLLSIGNAICAPTVTYNKEMVEKPIIDSKLKANIDWETWIYLANQKGSFIYINKPLLIRRIHQDSLTTNVLASNIMNEENNEIFKRFWGPKMAKLLTDIYSNSENNNNLLKKKEKNKMIKYLIVGLYLILTVTGLILYKYGSTKDFVFSISKGVFEVKLNIISIIGLMCYLLSFILYILILPKFDLTHIMPLTSAISYISIFVLSILILKESVTLYGIIGSFIILVGIIIMNLGGK